MSMQQCNFFVIKQILKSSVLKFKTRFFPKSEINSYFKMAYGHKANLDNPHNLMEIIYWMELHCDTSLWTK